MIRYKIMDEILKILGYSSAFFLAEMLVKIGGHL